ncbi:cobyrinate a,c-diamide synthase [Undibacterium sp.]|uniref:cobyrinate a,c-diamide synthase n=1 Tax=Undibacterium sp. TaxID=1914977 RepID=UPI002BEB5FB2|nr:cobyrinate a,c-diamide synthase [Undibacterium sp.]HTD02965.1 cobyrinate a,c-diamide synthase [Undibacterium sp.]
MNAEMNISATVTVVLVSAIASGQGKTTTTAALARKLVNLGKTVRVFKTGPDFIDPMMLERASGHPVQSLDLWMVGRERSLAMLAQAAQQAEVILIEGVMGLYDGQPSSADLARAFGVPVLAVVDASAMAQTVGAVVMGLRDFGPVHLTGVVANRVASDGHAKMIADAMRDIPLLATLSKQQQALPERHLGLVLPDEVAQLENILDQLAEQLALDMDAWDALPKLTLPYTPDAGTPALLQGKTIAIARDAAFAFIYPANLDCLRDLGAQLVFFSPIKDEAVPANADAVYLPGGYPELHAQALARAGRWQQSLHDAHAAGTPILAECGGMMVLCEKLIDKQGDEWPMLGLLPGAVVMQSRLAALGGQAWSTPQGILRGHAFHYSRFDTVLQAETHTQKHANAEPGEAIYRIGNLTASYFHSYFPSSPQAAAALFLPRLP